MRYKKFGLLGYPLHNTFSKDYFTQKFVQHQLRCTYDNFSLAQLQEVETFLLNAHDFGGFNVTMPYKKSIVGLLSGLSEEAQFCGAVNCLQKTDAGLWMGHNTDVYGFKSSLLNLIGSDRNLSALILGNGGAARAVEFVLTQLQIPYTLVGRSANALEGRIGYENLNQQRVESNRLLIQCTPVGMFPNVNDVLPIPFEGVGKDHYAFDLIYLPEKTQFLEACEKRGARISNGLRMLHMQADKAFEIWMENRT